MNTTDRQKYLVLLFIIAYLATFSTIAYLKYRSFSFYDIDLSVLNQTAWNTVQGKIIGHTPGEATILNGGHVFLILLLIAPLYALFTSPLTLLFLQTLALASGAWPIYLLGRDLIKPAAGLVLAFVYLIYPALNYVNLFEFHLIAFATPFLLYMFLFYVRKRWLLFLLFTLLALSCREDVAIPVFAFGLVALIRIFQGSRRDWKTKMKWALLPMLFGVAWFIACVKFVQPYFRDPSIATASNETEMLGFYSWLGNSSGEILRTIFFQPAKVLRGILIPSKLKYLKDLFLPLAFLPILSPTNLLMVVFSLAEGLLSQRSTHFSIRYQYSSIITPFIFISAVYGLRNLLSWKFLAGKSRYVLGGILICSIISAITLGPLFRLPGGIKQWGFTSEDKLRQKLIDRIPRQAPVITTFEFAPKLSMRPRLFYFYQVYASSRFPSFLSSFREAQKTARWALIDFNDILTFYDFYTPGGDRDVYDFLSAGNWQLLTTVNSLALFRKGDRTDLGLIGPVEPGENRKALNLLPVPRIKVTGYSLEEAEVMGNPVFSLSVYFSCLAKIREDLLLAATFTSRREPSFSFQQPFFAPYRIYPMSRWRPGEELKQYCNILVPEEAPPGPYDLTVALLIPQGRSFGGKVVFQKRNAVILDESE